jgi:hypothetical protein
VRRIGCLEEHLELREGDTKQKDGENYIMKISMIYSLSQNIFG